MRAITFAIAILLQSVGFAAETANFIVSGGPEEINRQVADAAENYRTVHWMEWFGTPPRPWNGKALIKVKVVAPQAGCGGSSSFLCINGTAEQFTGTWQGSPERLVDAVTPHEVMHMVMATEFGSALPRWIDEGVCSTIEHPAEQANYRNALITCLKTRRGTPMSALMRYTEYPADYEAFYAQSYSVAEFLVERGGRQKVMAFIRAGLSRGWESSLEASYNLTPASLQDAWMAWLRKSGGDSQHTVWKGPCEFRDQYGRCIPVPGYQMICGEQWESAPSSVAVASPPPSYANPQSPAPSASVAATKVCECDERLNQITADVSTLKEGLANLEAKTAEPGAQGPPGERGPAGQDGLAGKDGADGKDAVLDEAACDRIAQAIIEQAELRYPEATKPAEPSEPAGKAPTGVANVPPAEVAERSGEIGYFKIVPRSKK